MATSSRPKTAPPNPAGEFGIQKSKDADAVKANEKGTKGNFGKTVNAGKASGSPVSQGTFPNTVLNENVEDGEDPEPDYPEEQLPVKSKEKAKQEKKNQKKIHDEYRKLQLDTKQLLECWKKKIETIPEYEMMATLSTIITDIGNQQVQLGVHLAKYKEIEIKSYPNPLVHRERQTAEADGDRKRSEVLVDEQYPTEQPEIEGSLSKFRKEIMELRQEADVNKAKNKSLNDIVKELEKLLARAQVYETEVKTLKSLLEEREVESRKFEMEKNEALSRLSEIAGRMLRDNIPNVTDLSTQIRPIKIADMYRELYDNQWTDAFFMYNEERMGQEDIIKKLLKILTKAYQFCFKKCIRIYGALTCYGTYLNTSEEEPKTLELPENCRSLAKQLRKSLATVLLPELQKEYLNTFLSDSDTNEMKAYCQKCVEITWYMSLQTPQMVLVDNPEKGSVIDTALFSYYTVSGRFVDYVVWPACRFDNGGDLLSKGVIQPSKDSKYTRNKAMQVAVVRN